MSQIINIVLTCIAGLFALIGLFIGLGRRTYRSLIRIATIIIAAVLAVIVSRPIAAAVCTSLVPAVKGVLGELSSDLVSVFESSTALENLIVGMISACLAVTIYTAAFIVFALLMRIPYKIICHLIFNRNKKNKKHKEKKSRVKTESAPVAAANETATAPVVAAPSNEAAKVPAAAAASNETANAPAAVATLNGEANAPSAVAALNGVATAPSAVAALNGVATAPTATATLNGTANAPAAAATATEASNAPTATPAAGGEYVTSTPTMSGEYSAASAPAPAVTAAPAPAFAATDSGDANTAKKRRGRGDFPCDVLVGGVLGAFGGLLVCSFLMAPLLGMCGIAGTVLASVDDSSNVAAATDAFCNNWFVRSTNSYTTLITNKLTQVEIGGETFCLADEMTQLSEAVPALMAIIPEDGESMSLTELPDFLDKAADSDLLCTVAADLLSDAADAWSNGETYLNIKLPEEGAVGELIVDVVKTLGDATSENIAEDIKTVSKVVSILDGKGVLEALTDSGNEFDYSSVISDSTVMNDLVDAVLENTDMKELVPSIMNFGISMLDETLSLPENSTEIYNNMISELTEGLNTIADEAGFTEYGSKVIEETGADVDSEVSELLCKGMFAYLKKSASSVSVDSVEKFLSDVLGTVGNS